MADSYCDKLKKYYGVGGGNAYPAPGANGPAQTLYDNHTTYGTRYNSLPVMGSDSWPGSTNPSTAKIVH